MKTERLPVRSADDKRKALRWVEKMPMGWTLVFKPPTRTLTQNDRLWPYLEDIARQKEWCGKKRTRYQWRDLFVAGLKSQEIVPGLEGGFVALGNHSSELSPDEFSDLLQLVEAWGVQNQVVFTDPKQNTASGGERASEPGDGTLSGDGADARDLTEQ